MSEILSVYGKNATPRGFLDTSRPYQMTDADRHFKTLIRNYGPSATDALNFIGNVGGIITQTKRYELDKLWGRVERSFNKGLKLKVKAKEGIDELMTAFSFFYSALNQVDRTATDTTSLAEFKSIYENTRDVVNGKFVASLEGREQRNFLRIIDTIDRRVSAVGERFNQLVDEGKMAGSKIRLTLTN